MTKPFQQIVRAHKFFVKESPLYMSGTNKIEYYLYYPVAYIKFMGYMIKDIYFYEKIHSRQHNTNKRRYDA
jgi:hypothetical protein